MQSKATQTEEIANNILSTENKPDGINYEKQSQSETLTQVQKDNVITSQDLPNKPIRYGFTLLILSAFLFVIAIYYGIINP